MAKPEIKNFSYAVGFGKPPVHSRYKPGQSGNPKGRPRGRKNKNTILQEFLSQKITVRQGGKPFKMSKLSAMLLTLVNKALSGDLRSISALLPQIDRMESELADAEKLSEELSVDDQDILRDYVERAKNAEKSAAQ